MSAIVVDSNWIDQVREMVLNDSYFQELSSKWEIDSLNIEVYQKREGLFFFQKKYPYQTYLSAHSTDDHWSS